MALPKDWNEWTAVEQRRWRQVKAEQNRRQAEAERKAAARQAAERQLAEAVNRQRQWLQAEAGRKQAASVAAERQEIMLWITKQLCTAKRPSKEAKRQAWRERALLRNI